MYTDNAQRKAMILKEVHDHVLKCPVIVIDDQLTSKKDSLNLTKHFPDARVVVLHSFTHSNIQAIEIELGKVKDTLNNLIFHITMAGSRGVDYCFGAASFVILAFKPMWWA